MEYISPFLTWCLGVSLCSRLGGMPRPSWVKSFVGNSARMEIYKKSRRGFVVGKMAVSEKSNDLRDEFFEWLHYRVVNTNSTTGEYLGLKIRAVRYVLLYMLLHAVTYTDTSGSALSPLHTRFCDLVTWCYWRWMHIVLITIPHTLDPGSAWQQLAANALGQAIFVVVFWAGLFSYINPFYVKKFGDLRYMLIQSCKPCLFKVLSHFQRNFVLLSHDFCTQKIHPGCVAGCDRVAGQPFRNLAKHAFVRRDADGYELSEMYCSSGGQRVVSCNQAWRRPTLLGHSHAPFSDSICVHLCNGFRHVQDVRSCAEGEAFERN